MSPRQASLLGNTSLPTYCADTSAFIQLSRRSHPMESYPRLWMKLKELIEMDRIIAPREILKELEREDDDIFHWVKASKRMIVPCDEEQQLALRKILDCFPNCIKSGITSGFADPWVVAMAMVYSATVLTFEVPSGGGGNKIPDMCKRFGVAYMSPYEMIKEEGWKF